MKLAWLFYGALKEKNPILMVRRREVLPVACGNSGTIFERSVARIEPPRSHRRSCRSELNRDVPAVRCINHIDFAYNCEAERIAPNTTRSRLHPPEWERS